MLFALNLFRSRPIILKIFTEYDHDTTELYKYIETCLKRPPLW